MKTDASETGVPSPPTTRPVRSGFSCAMAEKTAIKPAIHTANRVIFMKILQSNRNASVFDNKPPPLLQTK
jgi:hypothetical protein